MWLTYTVTAYCACKLCCGPAAVGLTASGIVPIENSTVAGPRSIPFSSKVYIESIGWRDIQDRLRRKYDNRFDVYFKRHRDAKRFGKQKLRVWIQQNPQ